MSSLERSREQHPPSTGPERGGGATPPRRSLGEHKGPGLMATSAWRGLRHQAAPEHCRVDWHPSPQQLAHWGGGWGEAQQRPEWEDRGKTVFSALLFIQEPSSPATCPGGVGGRGCGPEGRPGWGGHIGEARQGGWAHCLHLPGEGPDGARQSLLPLEASGSLLLLFPPTISPHPASANHSGVIKVSSFGPGRSRSKWVQGRAWPASERAGGVSNKLRRF